MVLFLIIPFYCKLLLAFLMVNCAFSSFIIKNPSIARAMKGFEPFWFFPTIYLSLMDGEGFQPLWFFPTVYSYYLLLNGWRRIRTVLVFPYSSLLLLAIEWMEKDSNLRRRCQQIYSLPPLATRESIHMQGQFIFALDNIEL